MVRSGGSPSNCFSTWLTSDPRGRRGRCSSDYYLQCSVLADPLKTASAPLGVCIALEVGDGGRVVEKLVAADAGEAHEVRQVLLENLKRVLERYQDVRV